MELRGFDDYEVTLGDEMRGERAVLGKSLKDCERELRIRADVILGIENCDLDAFPNQSVVSGYVKSYAKYLGMDADETYRRFCQASGYQSPIASFKAEAQSNRSLTGKINSGFGAALADSRFAAPPATRRISAPVSLGGVASGLALIGLLTGLSYGGYALLQDIQRLGFAPLAEAPAVVADAPLIQPPVIESTNPDRPDPSAYFRGGALATLSAPTELPAPGHPSRDGPISAINPATSGLFLRHQHAQAADNGNFLTAGAPDLPARLDVLAAPPVRAAVPTAPLVAAKTPARPEAPAIVVHAKGEAWVRIRDESSSIIFEGVLAEGESFELPERVNAPTLRAGNAGSLYVMLRGVTYGPIGGPGQVVKGVPLAADMVRAALPKSDTAMATAKQPRGNPERVEAALAQ